MIPLCPTEIQIKIWRKNSGTRDRVQMPIRHLTSSCVLIGVQTQTGLRQDWALVARQYVASGDASWTFPSSTQDHPPPCALLLKACLCLFGDNAYLNSRCMASPYAGVSGRRTQDVYNFYHSQLQICINCCFRISSRKWAIVIRSSSIPTKDMSIAKTIALAGSSTCKAT